MSRLVSYLESIISGKRRGVISAILRQGLLPLSWIYLCAVKLRRWLYFRGILRARRLPCAVISVGNVVAGGSGKTPAVISIARLLKERADLNVAVLSRGYHSEAHCPAVVSDGVNVLLTPVLAGDEPYILGNNLPGVPVLIGRDRIQTGLMALSKWNCQVIILDDGFQYLKLARDIDIIVIDVSRPFGFDQILPRGYLREPLSLLKRADLILLTRVDQCENLDFVRARLNRIAPLVPVFESVYEPRSLCSLDTHQEVDLNALKDKKLLAVCGIANPASFARTLGSLAPVKIDLLSFPDHHTYPPSSMESIRRRAAETGVDMIVTTEKDAPKLHHIPEYPMLSLIIDLKLVGPTAGRFAELVFESIEI